MPTPPIPDNEHQRRIDAVHAALEAGFAPRGLSPGAGEVGAVTRAADDLGIHAKTMSTWAGAHKHRIEWSRYRHPVSNTQRVTEQAHGAMAEQEIRLKVRVSTAPPRTGERLKVCAIGDAHDAPDIPKDRARWLGRWVADVRPDVVVQIGDIATLDSLNSHVSNETYTGRAKPVFEEDMASLKEFLAAYDEGRGDGFKPEEHITLGNHEHRIWTHEDEAPHVVGMMQSYLDEVITGAGWTYSPYRLPYMLGGVGFVHIPTGLNGKPVGGKTSTNIIARDSVHDWVVGHTHRREIASVAKIGIDQRVTCINLGTALPEGYVEDYAKLSTTGWWWGAWELEIYDGRITDHHAVSMRRLEERYGNGSK